MRAIQVERPGTLRLVDVDEPVPDPGEAVIEVGACGICGTDLHILDGEFPPSPYPIVPGHEAAGTVVVAAEHDPNGFAVGDRVAIDPSLFCGACEQCRAGRGNLCSRWGAVGDTRDGALAERVCVPTANLYRIPDVMDFGAAALIEPVSCAVHALDRLDVGVGDRVLVCGAGTMGLIMASLIGAAGAASVAIIDRNESRLEIADRLGFTDTGPAVDSLADHGDGFDRVVDATGVPAVIEAAIGAVRKGGTMMVFGVAPPGARVAVDPFRIYNEEITIVGSMAVLASYGRAVDLVAAGTVDAGVIVTHRFGLDEFDGAFVAARQGTGLKVQIEPSS